MEQRKEGIIHKYSEILDILPVDIRKLIVSLELDFSHLMEIRLRVNQPMIIIYDNEELFIISEIDKIVLEKDIKKGDAYIVTQEDISEMLQYMSNFSLYAYEEDLRQGFITIRGGHRIGVAGKTIIENNRIKSMQHISYINVRIAHEICGCSNSYMKYIYDFENKSVFNTLIISPPFAGKTTLLRDIVKNISDGSEHMKGMTVGVVDERSEIAACYKGQAQNQMGKRTDVLDCCTKEEGILMLIRSMSPRVIAVDEIGGKKDFKIMQYSMNCGCKLLATIHGESFLKKKSSKIINKIIKQKMFSRYIILNNKKIGFVEKIINEDLEIIYEGKL